ncbi:MAG: AAA family ATPase [Lachnospiraceae bacterium]
MPIKDFLRFLQLYSGNLQLDESRKALLEFGEEYLLKGKVVQKDSETFYVEGQEGRKVPLYIASSMIHELTPFIKALSATQQIDWLYCDEVENSLHPLLQGEMARWLIRMVNAGMHVIISSHSDTMAGRMNNLFMLSQLDRRKADYKMLSELKLQEADLLRSDMKVGVYEFQSDKQGKTMVKKLEFIDYPLMGYDFQLFSENLDKLGDEADRITR